MEKVKKKGRKSKKMPGSQKRGVDGREAHHAHKKQGVGSSLWFILIATIILMVCADSCVQYVGGLVYGR